MSRQRTTAITCFVTAAMLATVTVLAAAGGCVTVTPGATETPTASPATETPTPDATAAPTPTPTGEANVWLPTGALDLARFYHTATLLTNGKVLVTGGDGVAGKTKTCELYDPAVGSWSFTGSFIGPARDLHKAVWLESGKVLVVGGKTDTVTGTCELYDPATGTWSATGSLGEARRDHTVTLLTDGRVLAAGGGDGQATASCELYDPTTGVWTATNSMAQTRLAHVAVLLRDGNVLVAGGLPAVGGGMPAVPTCELFDPGTGVWTSTGDMATARFNHAAVLLDNGRVLVAGGDFDNPHAGLSSCEVYDPDSGSWSPTGSLPDGVGYLIVLNRLVGSEVLGVGGFSLTTSQPLDAAELYHPGSGIWTDVGPMLTPHHLHTATLLDNGTVVVAGGWTAGDVPIATCEIYQP